MGRHKSHDILDKVVSGTLPVDQESAQIVPKGDDGGSLDGPMVLEQPAQTKPEKPFSNSDHLSPSIITGLGREAVRTRLFETQRAKTHQQEFPPDLLALNEARRQIMQLHPDERAMFQEILF